MAGRSILPGGETVEVVGEIYYQDAIEGIVGGKTQDSHNHSIIATLTPDPSNPHDANAVKIEIANSTVGHLDRSTAAWLQIPIQRLNEHLDAPVGCRGTIVGGWKRAADEGHFGVELDLDIKALLTLAVAVAGPAEEEAPDVAEAWAPPDAAARSLNVSQPPAATTAGAWPPNAPTDLPLHERTSRLLSELTARVGAVEYVARPEPARLNDELERVRQQRSTNLLANTPTAELAELTSRGSRLRLIEERYPTVGQLVGVSERSLKDIDGVGEKTARDVEIAVRHYAARVHAQAATLPYPDDVGDDDTTLLRAVGQRFHATRVPPAILHNLAEQLERARSFDDRAQKCRDRAWKLTGKKKRAQARAVLSEEVGAWLEDATVIESIVAAAGAADTYATPSEVPELIRDYRAHFAGYSSIADQFGIGLGNRPTRRLNEARSTAQTRPRAATAIARPLNPRNEPRSWTQPTSEVSMWGGLPSELARQIERQEISTHGLFLPLRPYQRFAVSFAAIQRRVVIGDEMGLGKTIEALALMAHLRAAENARRFLVVCPASILANWISEVERHTDLPVRVVHGTDREREWNEWNQHGGLALTSLATLSRLPDTYTFDNADLLVVDECHLVKNPDAKRSKAIKALANTASNVVLMSGTPMENRVSEFIEIARIVNPVRADALEGFGGQPRAGAIDFQRDIAPLYLRRKQDDVLHELPEQIEARSLIELTDEAEAAYRRVEASAHVMTVRRAATLPPNTASPKIARLAEILDECAADGFKVVVFSFFLDALAAVEKIVDTSHRIDGSVSVRERQNVIDGFSAVEGHAVLLSQIEAGGVGINLQAANVVVLMEPQWKPTTEWQAIKRVHRMGQSRPVTVHRLLTKGTIEEDIDELVTRKAAEFMTFADGSALKDESAEAVAGSDAELTAELQRRMLARQAAI